jgi:excisionase family DNA binding protein
MTDGTPRTPGTHELLTLEEAAAYLRVHPRTMARLLTERELPGLKVGRQWRIRRADLDAWVEAQARPAVGRDPAGDDGDDGGAVSAG